MRTIYLIIIYLFFNLNSFAQKIVLETFDTKESIKGWKIIQNKGVMKHTNSFVFNNQTFEKPEKDSFLVFYDTGFNANYSLKLSKKFKAIFAEEIMFNFALLSFDKEDNFIYSYDLLDKDNKSLLNVNLPYFSKSNAIYLIQSGNELAVKSDSVWKKADSLEVEFYFDPANPFDSIPRIMVIDDIVLNNVFTVVRPLQNHKFDIFPNPACITLNFKFSPFEKPNCIKIFDYTGKLVLLSKGVEQIDVKGLKDGIYFVVLQFENGITSVKKVEIN